MNIYIKKIVNSYGNIPIIVCKYKENIQESNINVIKYIEQSNIKYFEISEYNEEILVKIFFLTKFYKKN